MERGSMKLILSGLKKTGFWWIRAALGAVQVISCLRGGVVRLSSEFCTRHIPCLQDLHQARYSTKAAKTGVTPSDRGQHTGTESEGCQVRPGRWQPAYRVSYEKKTDFVLNMGSQD